jgi:recombination protein RecR
LCEICSDAGRDRTTICVVEGPQDVLSLERAGGYRGLYHCLGGKISPLDGVGMEDLRVGELMHRLEAGVQEVVLALGSDVEGETTTLQLAGELKKLPIKISRLAQGISVGGGLENHDPVTLAHALALRRPF